MKLITLNVILIATVLLLTSDSAIAQAGSKDITISFKSTGIGKRHKHKEHAKADAEGKAYNALVKACVMSSSEDEICFAPALPDPSIDLIYFPKGWKTGTTTLGGTQYDTVEGTYEGNCKCMKKPRDAFIEDEVIEDLIDIIIHDDPEFPYFE